MKYKDIYPGDKFHTGDWRPMLRNKIGSIDIATGVAIPIRQEERIYLMSNEDVEAALI